ncbi:hypothetical protein PSHT_14095 [Puccinia striiformis]|uniref:Conserved oligomeric Golgi complex subunit 5 helical domain-containing protein n=1 Tax=Puccinia striiformis TaxID=27350 RepID=A0A2S4ULV7_9BASI|nr:hypothetical protein PSHT_14095 [Puccinia striiformis]
MNALNRLDRYQAAAELSRRTSRIVYTLAKRLKAQMAELDQKPFQNHSDHDTPHHPGITIRLISQRTAYSIRSLKVIQPHVQRIVSARKKVEEQMSKILNQELVQLDLPMLSTSFQTAYNLSILVRSVGSLLFELTDLVAKKNELALNLNSLAKEAVANGSASSKESRETLRTSNFIAQTLPTNHPHLLQSFQESLTRLSIHIWTTYNTRDQLNITSDYSIRKYLFKSIGV